MSAAETAIEVAPEAAVFWLLVLALLAELPVEAELAEPAELDATAPALLTLVNVEVAAAVDDEVEVEISLCDWLTASRP